MTAVVVKFLSVQVNRGFTYLRVIANFMTRNIINCSVFTEDRCVYFC